MSAPDVLVVGEILVELNSPTALASGARLTLGISGDALNVAAASAAAGARTALLARVPDDELGDTVLARCVELGVDISAIVRGPGQHGLYLSHSDPRGEREFLYARRGSFGSTLAPDDLPPRLVEGAGVVTASGIACAISESAAATVAAAAATASRFVYDANLRPRLTSVAAARARLRELAPRCEVVKIAYPGEAVRLLDVGAEDGPVAGGGPVAEGGPVAGDGWVTGDGPVPVDGPVAGGGVPAEGEVLARLRALGVADAVLTRGPAGAFVAAGGSAVQVPAVPAPRVLDQTGAGDSFTGTMCARLALGDPLVEAARLASAAASLSVGGVGGTGCVPTLAQSRAHLATLPGARRGT